MICDAGGYLQPITEAVREYVKIMIDAQPTIKAKPDKIDSLLDEYLFRGGTLREWIDKIKRGEVRAERHGRWIETNDDTMKRCTKCDVIHLIAQYPHGNANYCPNCGAKMDGGKDDK